MNNQQNTLNPQQIQEAIKSGNVTDVTRGYANYPEEREDYDFNINGEHYRVRDGKIFVQYDFELDKSLLRKLHIINLKECIKRQQQETSEKLQLLAELQVEEENEEKNNQKLE